MANEVTIPDSGFPMPPVDGGEPGTVRSSLVAIGKERITPELAEQLENSKVPNISTAATMIEALLRVLFTNAIKGKSWAVTAVLDRIEDKQPLNIKVAVDHNLSDEELDKEIKRLENVITTTAVEVNP